MADSFACSLPKWIQIFMSITIWFLPDFSLLQDSHMSHGQTVTAYKTHVNEIIAGYILFL